MAALLQAASTYTVGRIESMSPLTWQIYCLVGNVGHATNLLQGCTLASSPSGRGVDSLVTETQHEHEEERPSRMVGRKPRLTRSQPARDRDAIHASKSVLISVACFFASSSHVDQKGATPPRRLWEASPFPPLFRDETRIQQTSPFTASEE